MMTGGCYICAKTPHELARHEDQLYSIATHQKDQAMLICGFCNAYLIRLCGVPRLFDVPTPPQEPEPTVDTSEFNFTPYYPTST